MSVQFSEGKKFLLNDKEIYDGAYITKVEKFNRKGYDLYEVWCEIFDRVKCIDGKKDDDGHVIETSVGKRVKCTLWLNEEKMFNMSDKNAIEIWAESKGLNYADDDFKLEDIVGAVFRLGIKNDDNGYAQINKEQIFPPKEGTLTLYKQYMEAKRIKEEKSDKAVTGKSEEKKKTRPNFDEFKKEESKKEEHKIDEKKDKRNPFLDED